MKPIKNKLALRCNFYFFVTFYLNKVGWVGLLDDRFHSEKEFIFAEQETQPFKKRIHQKLVFK